MAFDLGSFLQRELSTPTYPSRRSNKNHSGRAGRRAHRGAVSLHKVGGYARDVDAVYAAPDKELCVVVDSDVGWNEDGTPRREPRWG